MRDAISTPFLVLHDEAALSDVLELIHINVNFLRLLMTTKVLTNLRIQPTFQGGSSLSVKTFHQGERRPLRIIFHIYMGINSTDIFINTPHISTQAHLQI